MPAVRLAVTALAAAWLLAGGVLSSHGAIAVLASVAALVAVRERHHHAMAVTAGIAAGVSTIGLAVVPVLLGTAIARRIVPATLLLVATSMAAAMLVVGCARGTDASLLTAGPGDTRLLFLATASGTAVWLAATCSVRSPSPVEIDRAALLACLALPLLVPIGVEAAGLAIALAIGGTRPSLSPLTRGANDDRSRLRVRLA